MARSRASAKKAGSSFERATADYLAAHYDDRIDRKVRTGARDTGDIGGMRHMTKRVTIECKNTTRTNLGVWANEAETERGNDDGGAWLIFHKRHGKGHETHPEDQWVTTTLAELIALLTGSRDHLEGNE